MKEVTVKIPEEVKTVIEIATSLKPEDVLQKVYDEILRNDADYGKISIKEAAETMNKSQQFVRVALQQKILPFGAAVKMPSGKYSYYISPKKFYEFVGNQRNIKKKDVGTMTCKYCNGTGKYKKTNDKEKFNSFVECEMDKAYFVSYEMAIKKAYDKVGYTLIDCPYCSNVKE